MLAVDLISPDIPILSPEDRADKGLRLIREFGGEELPLVVENRYLGLMEELQLRETEDKETRLSDIPVSALSPAVQKDAHFFEAVKLFAFYRLKLLPVIDQSLHYKGSITVGNLLEELSRFNDIGQYGGLLILEMKPSDFMLSEIARIAESVDIVLLGVHTITEPASETFKVYLKTNLENLDIFVASL